MLESPKNWREIGEKRQTGRSRGARECEKEKERKKERRRAAKERPKEKKRNSARGRPFAVVGFRGGELFGIAAFVFWTGEEFTLQKKEKL